MGFDNCAMANYLTWGATDNSCSWYNVCDFDHLCVDCSKDTGPNCPTPQCPDYYAFTSEVLRLPTPTPEQCVYDNITSPVMYIGGNLWVDKHAVNYTSSPEACCEMCQEYADHGCVFWTFEANGCYGSTEGCCRLKTADAWSGRNPGQIDQT